MLFVGNVVIKVVVFIADIIAVVWLVAVMIIIMDLGVEEEEEDGEVVEEVNKRRNFI